MGNRTRQRDKILALLLRHRGEWVGLPLILPLASQYNSRILELRRAGWRIENMRERIAGQTHSWYRLLIDGPTPPAPKVDLEVPPKHAGLFPDLAPVSRWSYPE